MAPNKSEDQLFNPNEYLKIPKWINEGYFTEILEKDVPDYKSISKFTPVAATAPGENYTSIMVRVVIDVILKDGSSKEVSYILKTILDPGTQGSDFVSSMNLFPKEKKMYSYYLPNFEKLYQDAGVNIKLGPKCLHFDETPEKITLVMEDLKCKEFRNIDRLKGFQMNHMKAVLNKLAEFHAVSAVYHDLNGPYEDIFNLSFFNEANRAMFTAMYDPRVKLFNEAMMAWEIEEVEKYIATTPSLDEYFDENLRINEANPLEFNVLNHGDCWTNNIMMNHDEQGQVKETVFVDFQICKWGTPAQDLWYLFASSVDLDIKIKEFDHFICIYHKRLVECLKLLGYSKSIPTLRDMHIMMLKFGYWGLFTANSVCCAMLYPSDKESNMDNLMKFGPEGDAFRYKVFTNPIFIKAMKQWYPFLYNKGIFNISAKTN